MRSVLCLVLACVVGPNCVSGWTHGPQFSVLAGPRKTSAYRRQTHVPMVSVDDVAQSVYNAQLWAGAYVNNQVSSLTPTSAALVFVGGLLTSFSPCAMSLLPLTLGYLSGSNTRSSNTELVLNSAVYAIGLASVLSLFGLSAAFLGQVYGSSGLSATLPLASSLLAVLMGLNLLELVPLNFPSLDTGDFKELPALAKSFALGASSALIASPCSSPVLTSLLALVANKGDPVLGVGALFAYSLGYAAPVVTAGLFGGAFSQFFSTRGLPYINTVLACILVGYGTYGTLNGVWDLVYG